MAETLFSTYLTFAGEGEALSVATFNLRFVSEPRFVWEGHKLHQVLTLRRLQALQSLSLECWEQIVPAAVRTVVHHCPVLRKLSLDF